jgi:hypothetical protein
MISLFQSKGDQAFRAYVANRNECIAKFKLDSIEWQAAVVRGADLKARSEVWFKAADLLRKEEINNPSVNNPQPSLRGTEVPWVRDLPYQGDK